MKQVFSFITTMLAVIAVCYGQAANTKLSNLVSPTAVNVDLLPGGTTGTKNLGSDTKRWKNGYFNRTVYGFGVGNSVGVYGNGTTYGVFGNSGQYGVYGLGNSYGVYGFGGQYGVVGRGSSMGVRGVSDGVAVHGEGGTIGVTGSGEPYGIYGSSSGWAGYFLGKVYASGGYYTSDQKLKQNIRDFTSAMDIINKLKPKQYEFRQDGNYKLMNLPQGSHFGLIAQDVEKVLPDLVADTKFETDMVQPQAAEGALQQTQEAGETETQSEIIEFKALNYTELIPVLIKGIQELSAINDEKVVRINLLQIQNQELKSKLEKLEAVVFSKQSQFQSVELTAASRLEQNIPNPFNNTTTIDYFLPVNKGNAFINFYASNGALLKSVKLVGIGKGTITLKANELPSGAYQYALVIDGKVVDSKQMVQTK